MVMPSPRTVSYSPRGSSARIRAIARSSFTRVTASFSRNDSCPCWQSPARAPPRVPPPLWPPRALTPPEAENGRLPAPPAQIENRARVAARKESAPRVNVPAHAPPRLRANADRRETSSPASSESICASPNGVCQLPADKIAMASPRGKCRGPSRMQREGILRDAYTAPATWPEYIQPAGGTTRPNCRCQNLRAAVRGIFVDEAGQFVRVGWIKATGDGGRANHCIIGASPVEHWHCQNQIAGEGLPLMSSASAVPGIQRIFTWSPV